MINFWEKLDRPFFCLAPMSDVTDSAFRYMLAKYGKNRKNKNQIVFWTEFISADGLCNKLARKKLSHILRFKEIERPIVAQVFGANPENMKKACQYIASLDFDGIDINMGCPDKSVIAQGAGAALIKTPDLARKIIRAANEGIKTSGNNIPLSVKTRIGFSKEEIGIWIKNLLEEDISVLTVHLRTKKEMSLVSAHWEFIPKILALRDKISPEILIIGNGDVESLDEAKEKAKEYGVDGVMIGRGVFGKPWFFAEISQDKKRTNSKFSQVLGRGGREPGPDHSKILINSFPSLEQKLETLVEHTKLFEKELGEIKSFDVMKKHYKAYVNGPASTREGEPTRGGFPGAKELRIKLMETKNSKEVEKIIKEFLKSI
jgi:tRNA-dihydrouridine synthase